MKKIFITFMAAVSLLTFNRCTSLDMEPVSSISDANYWKSSDPVSYTHLTLPTICSV